MGERTSYTPGTFCWADLGTADPDSAAAFYGALFGWQTERGPVDPYSMFALGGRNVAGLYRPPADQPPPGWLSYVSVQDADATAARARELGGQVLLEPHGVGVGRGAFLQDPQGAVFGVWQAGSHIGASLVNDPGAMVWNQLATSDVDAAQRFYTDLFGWSYEPLEGSSDPYWEILGGDGRLNGGVMGLPARDLPSHWLVMFTVAAADEAAELVGEHGGEVTVPPTPVPTGRFAAMADPHGASFGLFEGENDP
jgi:predicted enzyme related to lactoylglutathione lyase